MIGLGRRRFSGLVVVLLLLIATGLAAESPFDVGDRAQLFVDRILVHKADRIFFTQHSGRPHPENPLIQADRPWEGWRLEMHGTVIYDQEEGIFKMWYLGDAGDSRDYFDSRYFICYATSSDGIRWEKPLVGTLPSNNGQPHNAVLTGTTLGNVVKDSRDPDPNRRYKMMGSNGKTYVSPDGLHWRPYSQGSVWPDLADATTGFRDERRSLFVMFPKVGNRARTYWLGHKRRLFYTITSRDFVDWTEPVLTWTTDARDDAGSLARLEHVRSVLDRPDDPRLMRTEYYGIGVYTAESCTIGFPWIFTINNNARWGNHEGPQEVQLAVSRDLFHWERPFRTPVIPMGDMGEWDCCYQATGNRALRVGDEIRVYYDGANYTHGTPALYRAAFEDGRPTGRGRITASIGLATWPSGPVRVGGCGRPGRGSHHGAHHLFRIPPGAQRPDRAPGLDYGRDPGRGRQAHRGIAAVHPLHRRFAAPGAVLSREPGSIPLGRATGRPALSDPGGLPLQLRVPEVRRGGARIDGTWCMEENYEENIVTDPVCPDPGTSGAESVRGLPDG